MKKTNKETKKERKEKKQKEKQRKKLKSTLEWMEIDYLDSNGIYLKKNENSKLFIVKGLQLQPINLYLLTDAEKTARIMSLSNAIDKLYNYQLYFKFVKTQPDTTMQTASFLRNLEAEDNPAVAKIINMQINKLDWFRNSNREVKFYVLIQDDVQHIDKTFDILRREFASAWGSYSLIKPMGYTDYKEVIQQEFNNSNVDEYLFTEVALPNVDILELEKEKNKIIENLEERGDDHV